MGKNIKIIQVAFNVLDPDQQRAFEYTRAKSNSSGYIKRLIEREMGGLSQVNHSLISRDFVKQDDNFEFDAGGFI